MAADARTLLDIDAAAARLGVTPRYIRHAIAQRTIPHIKVGRLVRFDPADLDAYVTANRREAVPV
jgi:excisionase family DNA binding protein